MKYIHGTEDFTLDKDSAVTLGKFDGVHMGHQKLISIVEEKAKQMGITIIVETDGSGGTKNAPTAKEIEECEAIIVAADKNVEMARFDGTCYSSKSS